MAAVGPHSLVSGKRCTNLAAVLPSHGHRVVPPGMCTIASGRCTVQPSAARRRVHVAAPKRRGHPQSPLPPPQSRDRHVSIRHRLVSGGIPTPLGGIRIPSPADTWLSMSATSDGTSTAVRDSAQSASDTVDSSADTSDAGSADVAPDKLPPAEVEQRKEGAPVTKDVLALKSLDAYFDKLKGPEKKEEEKEKEKERERERESLVKASVGVKSGPGAARAEGAKDKSVPESGESTPEREEELQQVMDLLREAMKQIEAEGEGGGNNASSPQVITFGASSPYQLWLENQLSLNPPSAVSIILAINVAVFLFELASPEAIPGLIVTSLPCLLGAKVNALISAGEWWRLVTPMFLHAGIFHILLGSVVLLSLGPSVEVVFGSVGFLSAYFVGGVFGNLLSFLQTADATVGGTGPIYGIVGAVLVYLWKNRALIGKEESDDKFWSLVFFAALNVAIGSALPIDDWTHIGGALGGLLFGALAAPTLKQTDAPNPDKILQGEENGFKIESVDRIPFALEGPGPERQALIAALCLGVAALLLELSTVGIPTDLLDISTQISTV